MLRMLVGRCHVGQTNREVVAYVASLTSKSWAKLDGLTKRSIIRECIRIHRENRDLYAAVVNGRL